MKTFAIQVAKKAGHNLMRHFSKFSLPRLSFKYRHEIVTQVDLETDRLIRNLIQRKYPKHNILTEEGGFLDKKSEYTWIVDPLDGTTNYSIRHPLFSVSIALAKKDEIILGVVWAPYLKELFVAEKGGGAFLNNHKIKVSAKSKIKDSILTLCHGHSEKEIKRFIKFVAKLKLAAQDCRQLGSAALELSFVASGRVEAIIIPGAHLWDVAAGVIIVREAQGKVTDFQGKEWTLKSKDIAASNGKIHSKILKLLKK